MTRDVQPQSPPTPTVYQLAAQAHVDHRTVRRALAGHPIKGQAGERVRTVLAAAGLLPAKEQL